MTNAWIEFKLIFISLIPFKLDSLVPIIDNLEGSSLSLSHNTVSYDQLIFQVIREPLKGDILSIAFPTDQHLMLLKWVMLRIERQ